jgi:hypothetical protein
VAPNLVENTHSSMEKGNDNHELGTGFFVHGESYQQLKV